MSDFYFSESSDGESGSGFGDRFAPRHRFLELAHAPAEPETEELLPAHPEIIELIVSLLDANPHQQPASEQANPDRPRTVYLPEHYEAGYAYPLVVWFHGDGATEDELHDVMPRISDRNYIGLALRGETQLAAGFGWSPNAVTETSLVEDVRSAVTQLRRQYHIHSERIYLAGFGTGATTALQLMLHKPEWFGGVISFSGDMPTPATPLQPLEELKNKRILLTASLSSAATQVGDVVATGRLLYSAGMQVGTRVYQGGETRPTNKMLRDLNSWLMDDICGNVKV